MRPFAYTRADSASSAIQAHLLAQTPPKTATVHAPSQYLAGGTTLIDLMKLDVMRPEQIVDINALEKTPSGEIEFGARGLRLGALARMADTAEHPDIRNYYPVVTQSLQLAASQQLRNMASLGGNVLQRTRCTYFRDTSYTACNKRNPSSGCAALEGINRMHAVLGTSDNCIATYPGDFGQALIALDAQMEISGPQGSRRIPFANLHRPPADTPHLETNLGEGDLIMAFVIPALPWARRSKYLKIRDRQSYEFALASAAVALDMDGSTVRDSRIALGGVATLPWRSRAAEEAIRGKTLDEGTLQAVADTAFATAKAYGHNKFKIDLGKQTLVRALRETAAMEI